jgi:hypothetical protein
MKTIIMAAIAAGMLVIVVADALCTPAVAQPQTGAYCQAGFDALMVHRGPPDPNIVYRSCQPGDTIVIPGAIAALAAMVCDFNKAIFTGSSTGLGATITCVVSPPRPLRSSR